VIAIMLGLTVKTVETDVQRARKANPDAVPRRGRGRALSPVQCAEICVLKAEGRSHAAIARALGVAETSVRRVLRRAAVAEASSDPRPAVGTIGSQIVTMWETGHTARAIADRFGIADIDYVYEVIGRMAPGLKRRKELRARGQSMLQQVAALRRQKRSNREITYELGITRDTVTHYVRRGQATGEIARRRPVVSNAQAQEIIALNAAGSICGREIARRIGVSHTTVYRVLRIAGVAPSIVARRQQLKSRILALREAGWKNDTIASVCGTTCQKVRDVASQAARKNPALRRQAPPLSAAEIERIAALRREDCYNGAEIAELMNANHRAVTNTIRKLALSEPGLSLDRRLIAKDRLPEVLLLMAQDLPPAAIAERFSVGRTSMRRLLYKLRRRAKNRGALVTPGVELRFTP
jgi:DNA-binding CsgD family transcriptional regulator